MRVLLVEDQQEKREQIKEFIKDEGGGDFEITVRESLRGALKEIVLCSQYDLILLDMSMPNFDPASDNPADCSPESFAGQELLEQMKLRDIGIPVIIITQYATFEGGAVTLEDLKEKFSCEYSNFYLGSVYFNSPLDTWKKELLDLLRTTNG